MPKRVMISAGEASGELYGALLSRAVKKMWPDTEIIGIGGNRMKKEGVHLIAPISSAIGLSETVRHWSQIIGSFNRAKQALIKQRPDILVLIDYPDFNIALAKKAKSVGIPVLYYVSPQVWAWRAGRVKKIAAFVNKIAVLFPFEVDIYRKTGLACEFVGHPIAETVDISHTKKELRENLGLDLNTKVIALLPGSRPSEIRQHEQLIIEVAEKIHNEYPEMQIIVPLVSGTDFTHEPPDCIRVINDRTAEVVASAEAIAVASGTATLEAALLGTPMVVFYKLSTLTVFFAKLLVKVEFISLVNLLSGKEVIVELIQNKATSDKLFSELKKIISNNEYRQTMVSNLQKIRDMMGQKTASERVASIMGELAGWSSTSVY